MYMNQQLKIVQTEYKNVFLERFANSIEWIAVDCRPTIGLHSISLKQNKQCIVF